MMRLINYIPVFVSTFFSLLIMVCFLRAAFLSVLSSRSPVRTLAGYWVMV